MRYTTLGRSGLIVSDLSLGTMIFGDSGPRGTPEEDALELIRAYVDAGGNFLDTANVYVDGESERIVGRALRDLSADVLVATKVRFAFGDGRNDVGLSRRAIFRSVHASLTRLGVDALTPLEETLRALDDLVREGSVRYLGASNLKAWQLTKALALQDAHGWARFVAAQYQYSLVVRDLEYEFADLLAAEGVGLVPWGPLGGGFLSGKYRRDAAPEPGEGRIAHAADEHEESWERRDTARNWAILDAVERIAAHHGASVPQVALAWLRAQDVVDSTILGVRTAAQLSDNLGAADLDLSPEELTVLNEASALPELYPYRMLEAYATRRP